MHETEQELAELQDLLDQSYAGAGKHLLSVHTATKRLSAPALCDILSGACALNFATVNSKGQPLVAPVDGLFLGGQFWFGSSVNALRFKHIRQNPNVSAAYTRGEEVSVLVSGLAHKVDTASGRYERLHDYCIEVYGPDYDSLGQWGHAPFARVEATRMFAVKLK